MNPIDFPEANFTFHKPADMTDEECGSLRVHRAPDRSISCWQPTDEERLRIAAGGPIWLSVWGGGHPPVLLEGTSPFEPPAHGRGVEPQDYAPCHGCWHYWGKHNGGCGALAARVGPGEHCKLLVPIHTHPADCRVCAAPTSADTVPPERDLSLPSHPLHAEYLKWQRQEPHLCLNCGKAPPFNGCSALCPECIHPASTSPGAAASPAPHFDANGSETP